MKSSFAPLEVDGYRRLARLDEPFKAPEPAPEKKIDREALVDELLTYFRSELPFTPGVSDVNAVPSSYEGKRRILQALLTVRGSDPLPSRVHTQLDRLLQRETLERGLTQASNLPRIALQTVEEWLSRNPDTLDLVIFNVFREDDLEIYERLLKAI